jgi:hypothetical protein
MFDENHYVPVLKWRQGEYQALFRADSAVKARITPLFEIPAETWDFENACASKSLDEHLAKFGQRLKEKWGSEHCFIDSCYINGSEAMASGTHHLEHLFELARKHETQPIPVTGLGRKKQYQDAVAKIIKMDGRGGCFRLVAGDFDRPNFKADLDKLLQQFAITQKDTDIVIDLVDEVASSAATQASTIQSYLLGLPYIDQWRSLTVASTAFPKMLSPAGDFRPSGKVNRTEWLAYKQLRKILGKATRVPTFSDYGVAHPETQKLDPRLIDPNAKIKYTLQDEWFVTTGMPVKKHGREQYHDLCQTIVSAQPTVFAGKTFSYGDDYINECAAGGKTGGSSTWPCVMVNHHMTRVVNDLASLYGT